MTGTVEKIVAQVRQLDRGQFGELLTWLADYQLAEMDEWDRELERDARPGGRLDPVLRRVRRHLAEGKTRELDEVLNHP